MTAEIIRITALLITVSAFSLLIKQYRPELSVGLNIAVTCVVLLVLFEKLSPTVFELKELFEKGDMDVNYFYVALKAMGIAYITGFAADTCRDFGQNSLAAKAEFAGKCAVLIICLPLLSAVLGTALEFAGV